MDNGWIEATYVHFLFLERRRDRCGRGTSLRVSLSDGRGCH